MTIATSMSSSITLKIPQDALLAVVLGTATCNITQTGGRVDQVLIADGVTTGTRGPT